MNEKSFSLNFTLLTSKMHDAFPIISDFYKHMIERIYGNQKEALEKIAKKSDRRCELLTQENGTYSGAIVYKTSLSQELSNEGLYNVFELKSMFLLNENKKKGGLMFALLLKRAAIKASEANAHQITCTVSSLRMNVLTLLKKFGFSQLKTMQNKYVAGVNEHLLIHYDVNQLHKNLDLYLSRIYFITTKIHYNAQK